MDETNATDLVCQAISDYVKRGGQVLFWTCPNGCRGQVEWRRVKDVHVARCLVCGRSSAGLASQQVACTQCGLPVEDGRKCYASPICYRCLPPPDPLPIAKLSNVESEV
jgi:hypothetical protein